MWLNVPYQDEELDECTGLVPLITFCNYFLVGGSAYRFAQTGSCSPLETVQKTLARLRYMRNIQPPTP